MFGKKVLPDWATHVWIMEDDVGWTGSLLSIFQSIVELRDGAPTRQDSPLPGQNVTGITEAVAGNGSVASRLTRQEGDEPDYVACEVWPSSGAWYWFKYRNWNDTADMQLWRSLLQVARYSRRMMDTISDSMREGQVQFVEGTAPSLCASKRHNWCHLHLDWSYGHPVIGRDRRTGQRLYGYDAHVPLDRWNAQLAADSEVLARCRAAASTAAQRGGPVATLVAAPECRTGGWLYHTLKW